MTLTAFHQYYFVIILSNIGILLYYLISYQKTMILSLFISHISHFRSPTLGNFLRKYRRTRVVYYKNSLKKVIINIIDSEKYLSQINDIVLDNRFSIRVFDAGTLVSC